MWIARVGRGVRRPSKRTNEQTSTNKHKQTQTIRHTQADKQTRLRGLAPYNPHPWVEVRRSAPRALTKTAPRGNSNIRVNMIDNDKVVLESLRGAGVRYRGGRFSSSIPGEHRVASQRVRIGDLANRCTRIVESQISRLRTGLPRTRR